MKLTARDRRRIVKIARDAMKEDPDGDDLGCVAASECVHDALSKAGIRNEIDSGVFALPGREPEFHEWIVLEDYDEDVILDPTADQFGDFPRVWVPADPKYYFGGPMRVRRHTRRSR